MKKFLCLLLLSPSLLSAAVELVKEGRPVSEIIVAEAALPQVRFAARELQEHLERMSGAKVPIVHAPSGGGVFPVYIGEGEETRALGVSLEKVPMEGYRVIANEKALVLAGRDARFDAVPKGFESVGDLERLTKEWQEFTGRQWAMPLAGLYDPRNRSRELDFSLYDPTGTLFAVYDLLEQLGVRWYYPDTATGTVIPGQSTITVKEQDHSSAPVFSRRFMRWTFPAADPEGFLWFKRQKLGMSEMVWFCHGTGYVTRLTRESHPEFVAVSGGEASLGHKGKKVTPTPRLGPPLRDEMIDFADRFFAWAPEMRSWAAAPSDGFVNMDDRDRAAGWDRTERGNSGRFSDYIWSFVNDVAKGVAKKHPDRFVMGLAYGRGRAVPEEIDRLSPNVGVAYCQTRSLQMIDPGEREAIRRERNAWIAKMGNQEFYIWEYYLNHENHHRLPGVPVIFTRIMQEDARDLRGKSKGEYVECSYGHHAMKNPALNHYPYMVQARLYWDPDLDLDAFLDEYCRKYYGPAAQEMKTFLTFAEEVWMRPAPHVTGVPDSFLQAPDVERFFSLLEQAKARAGEGIYGKRVAQIAAECEPMRGIISGQKDYEKGVAAARAGENEAAARFLEAAAATSPDSFARLEALLQLAPLYRDVLNDREAAIRTLQRIWEIPPKSLPKNRAARYHALIDCVGLLRAAQRYDEALAMLEQTEPEKAGGYWKFQYLQAYGLLAEDRGDHAAAQNYYREALEVRNVPDRLTEKLRGRLD
ncbi:MAG TPA: DUF4838 domain-containing protein [Chthoniobacteraceae bacterium]|nr:DUF4838 domain-containing protein [Chthoniobacteraceae bacterium]